MAALSKVPLFKRLPKSEHPGLAAAFELVAFEPGDIIIRQGEPGSEFFVILSGEATVSIVNEGEGEPEHVATLKDGDYFGESALLRNEPRAASIVAQTPLEAFRLTRASLVALRLTDKLTFVARKAVGGGGGSQGATKAKAPTPKTEEERRYIAEVLQGNANLQVVVTWDDERLQQMIDVMWKESVTKGTQIIKQGDTDADFFYVVQQGSFKFSVSGAIADQNVEKLALAKMSSSHVESSGQGVSFGELALLYFAPRAATVTAVEESVVWVMDRWNFKNILMKASEAKTSEYERYLNSVPILAPLLAEEKLALAKALEETQLARDEVIMQQGEPGSSMYLLYDGEVKIMKDGQEVARLVASEAGGVAEIFGERALLTSEPRAATVVVTSEVAKLLVLDRGSFNSLLGPLQDLIDHKRSPTVGLSSGPMQHRVQKKTTEQILKQDLRKIGLLGCGDFGVVELWEHTKTGESYALKSLSKGNIVKMRQQQAIMNAKNILIMTDSPFVVKVHATYNSAQTLDFLLEPALGGELFATYNRRNLYGQVEHAKYYAAGVVFAFQHLHERHILYRDLKPENLLFTEKGHIKLTDMGLAKFAIGKTYTTCGTPDYFAPEIVSSSGHTKAVDWWTLGILLFELLSGEPPFLDDQPMDTYRKGHAGHRQGRRRAAAATSRH